MATKNPYIEQDYIYLIPGLSRSMSVNINTNHIVFNFSYLGEKYTVPGYRDDKGYFKTYADYGQNILNKYIERHRHEAHVTPSNEYMNTKQDYVKTIAKLADLLANSSDQKKIDRVVRVIEEA